MSKKADIDDPNRCTGATKFGQCHYLVEDEGHDRCRKCRKAPYDPREEASDFLTKEYLRRVRLQCNPGEEVEQLRENLMTINAMMAARRNQIKTFDDLLIHSGPLADLAAKAEKLTNTLARLSFQNDFLIAKPALIRWTQDIVTAISDTFRGKYEGWENDVAALSDELFDLVKKCENKPGEKPDA